MVTVAWCKHFLLAECGVRLRLYRSIARIEKDSRGTLNPKPYLGLQRAMLEGFRTHGGFASRSPGALDWG